MQAYVCCNDNISVYAQGKGLAIVGVDFPKKLTVVSLLWVGMASAELNLDGLLGDATAKLSAKMFSEVARKHLEKGESSVMSAFSVMTPLAVLALGSEGLTHSELNNAVGFRDGDDDDMVRALSLANDVLSKEKGIILTMANRIYLPYGNELNRDLAQRSSKELGTELKTIDFVNPEQAASTINQWVAEKTKNKIVDLINESDINRDTEVVIVNALYFYGRWLHPFTDTYLQSFHKTTTNDIQVPLMQVWGQFKFAHNHELDAKVLEMDYYDSDSSFVIILPNKISGLASLLNKTEDPSKLGEALTNVSLHHVHASVPKFKIETETDLKDVLSKVGVKHLFEANELTKILKYPESLAVSKAVQKAFISLDEVGTEAAAANKVVLFGSSGGAPPEYERFIADHPFVFLIKSRNLILFSGVYDG